MAPSAAGTVLSPPGHPRPHPAPAGRWPHSWPEREALLERQHERLEALLITLLQEHIRPLPVEQQELTEQAEQLACRRLLWDLRLHLRLEERWLEGCGALCPGHRANHREAAQMAFAGYMGCAGSRRARLAWLQELNGWFTAHRQGPDAMAYALARQEAPGPPSTG